MNYLTSSFLLNAVLALCISIAAGAQTTTIVDTVWIKSNARRDFAVLETPAPDDPSWVYTSQVWTGGPVSRLGCPIPDWQPGYHADHTHFGGCFDPATHQWFRTGLELDRVDNIAQIELIALFRPEGNVGINDNLYVWANAATHTMDGIVAYGGTSELPPVQFPPQLTDRLAPSPLHGDGSPCGGPTGVPETAWNIEVPTLPTASFQPGMNSIDVLLESFCIFGGMSHLAFRITTISVVEIDVKPGSDPNSINPRSKGKIPVAILTTSTAAGEPLDFDAWDVEPSTLAFGPQSARIAHIQGHAEDVDADGDLDMVVHFKTRETGIACDDTEATLTGETVYGEVFMGSDAIRTVGCRRSSAEFSTASDAASPPARGEVSISHPAMLAPIVREDAAREARGRSEAYKRPE